MEYLGVFAKAGGLVSPINISALTYQEGDIAVLVTGSETLTYTVTGSGATSTARPSSSGPTLATVPLVAGDTAITASGTNFNMISVFVFRNVDQTTPLINGAAGLSGVGPTLMSAAGGYLFHCQSRVGSTAAVNVLSWAAVPDYDSISINDGGYGSDYAMGTAWAFTPDAASYAGPTFNYTVNSPYGCVVQPPV